MIQSKHILGIVLLLMTGIFHTEINSQTITSLNNHPEWLIPSDSLNKNRFILFTSSTAVTYGAAIYGLNNLWYADFPRGSFKWINDIREWKQVDKAGHMVTPYLEARYLMEMMQWTGLDRKKAAIYAGLAAFMFQNTIEVFDGFSAEWGASASDVGANFLGAALMTSQELIWGEQRMMLKILPVYVNYADDVLKERADFLFGSSYIYRFIKDYNSINVWLSINPSSFNGSQKRFKWLNIAFGYGAGGMFGGYENTWTDSKGVFHDRSDIIRYRRFMLSLDVDFTKIQTRSRYLKTIFSLLNIVKVPAPAIEFNTKGQVLFHPLR
jgi:hypothetical protein